MTRIQQLNLLPPPSREHGGSLAVGRRRARRPLATKEPLHVTMKSLNASEGRVLTQYAGLIRSEAYKWAKRFEVKIYAFALCSNHLHMSLCGKRRTGLQHFFRVFAGQVAQKILKLSQGPRLRPQPPKSCQKNRRTFWSYLVYSRVLKWGREFRIVCAYILRNELEAMGVIAYKPREKIKRRRRRPPSI